ncbi:MAG TPA: hypothetical protein VFO55_00885 [Gemmatimonadaceae bacterium]|nr:hypothetical protein [Gemmatimonadaceae bacterium]
MAIFLLSPARCDGRRSQVLMNPEATFQIATELRSPGGAAIGEVFSFLSGLYFRGKLAYANAFGAGSSWVITTNRGLVTPDARIGPGDIAEFASVDLSKAGDSFLAPLVEHAEAIARSASPDSLVVLLGSIATPKYVTPLERVFGERLVFPREFVGRGDMSRGGLLLRQVTAGEELEYIPVRTAVRHGKRPPKLEPVRRR